MAGLKAFRTLPKSLTEWGRWCQSQDVLGATEIDSKIDTAIEILDTTTTVETSSSDRWVVEFFDGNYQLLTGDASKVLCSTSASACNLTVPPGALDVGEQFTALQYGAGQLTIVADTGVTINTPTNLTVNEQHGTVTLICIDYDEYLIAGRMTP